MFYILSSRIPFIYNAANKNDKLFRSFFIGSICYIILHSLLNSKKFENMGFVQKYKKIIFYIASCDITICSFLVYFLDKQMNEPMLMDIENDNESNDDSESEDSEKVNNSNVEKFIENVKNNSSPFITKTDAEEILKQKEEPMITPLKPEPVPESVVEPVPVLEPELEPEQDNSVELIEDTDIPIYE